MNSGFAGISTAYKNIRLNKITKGVKEDREERKKKSESSGSTLRYWRVRRNRQKIEERLSKGRFSD